MPRRKETPIQSLNTQLVTTSQIRTSETNLTLTSAVFQHKIFIRCYWLNSPLVIPSSIQTDKSLQLDRLKKVTPIDCIDEIWSTRVRRGTQWIFVLFAAHEASSSCPHHTPLQLLTSLLKLKGEYTRAPLSHAAKSQRILPVQRVILLGFFLA